MKKIPLDRDDKKRLKAYTLRKQLFARLGSIPSLATLPKMEKRAVVREAERAGIATKASDWVRMKLMPPVVPAEAQQAWGMKTPPPPAWGALFEFHPWVRKLPDLLDGKILLLPVPSPPAKYKVYELHAGVRKAFGVNVVAQSRWVSDGSRIFSHDPTPCEALLEDFAESLTESKLPYRRCPECKALFVVLRKGERSRGKPKEYCSSRCTSRAAEARRDPVERRKYQRELMHDRRQYGKEPKRPKKKTRG